MAWIRVEASVPRNRKFMIAGPAPSWLWLCGLAYCQEGLTDGFIPSQALPYLGVKNAGQLAAHLVKAGLWHVEDGGWRVHDYLEHNRSASDVETIRGKRGAGGVLGGRPRKTLEGSAPKTLHRNHTKNPSVAVDASVAVTDLVSSEGVVGETVDPSVQLQALQASYPQNRVTYGYRTETAFIGQLATSPQAFALMQANLEQHKRSHEWSVSGMVPALEKWLSQGLWKQQHKAASLPDDEPVPFAPWHCPHVEPCGAKSTCVRMKALSRPERAVPA